MSSRCHCRVQWPSPPPTVAYPEKTPEKWGVLSVQNAVLEDFAPGDFRLKSSFGATPLEVVRTPCSPSRLLAPVAGKIYHWHVGIHPLHRLYGRLALGLVRVSVFRAGHSFASSTTQPPAVSCLAGPYVKIQSEFTSVDSQTILLTGLPTSPPGRFKQIFRSWAVTGAERTANKKRAAKRQVAIPIHRTA